MVQLLESMQPQRQPHQWQLLLAAIAGRLPL
jgi:hypothetical protein